MEIKTNDVIILGQEGELSVNPNAVEMILHFEESMKNIKDQYSQYRQALLKAMKENGIKKIETPEMTISYIEPDIRFIPDNDKLWKEYKDIAFKCQKESKVKESVRIRLKGRK